MVLLGTCTTGGELQAVSGGVVTTRDLTVTTGGSRADRVPVPPGTWGSYPRRSREPRGVRRSPRGQLNLDRPLTDLQRKSCLEASIAETMAAARAADEHGGGSDHGGRSRRQSSDRRRLVGILCSVLLVVQLGGLLVQVFTS